jgi:hypothetical protein
MSKPSGAVLFFWIALFSTILLEAFLFFVSSSTRRVSSSCMSKPSGAVLFF